MRESNATAYRMFSFATECVLLLQNVFSYNRMCSLTAVRESNATDVDDSLFIPLSGPGFSKFTPISYFLGTDKRCWLTRGGVTTPKLYA